MNKDPHYEKMFSDIVSHFNEYHEYVSITKEQALLQIYWDIAEKLRLLKPLTDNILDDFKAIMNERLDEDSLFNSDSTNSHWLKLAVRWVEEHQEHDKSVMLSGKAAWVDWALVLDIVNSPPHRYWLVCQTIKNKWDRITLLREAQKLPKEYLNFD